METVARIASVVLGAVFVVAGATKVAAGSTWVAQARQMGATQPVATVLPGVEILLGALLIAGVAVPVPALSAILLLVVFSVVVARQLVEGRHPPCACFGAWSTRPLAESHLLANVALIGIAIVACWA
ncbi:MAG: MauE/DoxX family redox-associated membrane protein [Ilumatobacteraceae bacterium]